MNLLPPQSRWRMAVSNEVAVCAGATVDCSASIDGGSRRDGNIRSAEPRMLAAALRVKAEPLQCTRQGGILTLIHAEHPAQDQPSARNWRRAVERAGPALLIALLVVLWQVLT